MNKIVSMSTFFTALFLSSCTSFETFESHNHSDQNTNRVQKSRSEQSFLVWLQAHGQKKSGQGIMVRSREGCVVLTAAHVVRDRDKIDLAQSNVRNMQGLVKTSNSELDLTIVEISNKEITNCRQLPSPKQLQEALLDSYGNVWILTERGIRNIVSVHLRSIDGNKLHLKTADPDDNFSKGMSGAPLIMNGIIVGILQKTKVNSREAIALKIDSARHHLSDYFDSYNAAPKKNTDCQPFDIRQLPDDMQILVQQARRIRSLAEATKQRALDNEKEVDRAVTIAKDLDPNQYDKGYAHFTSENGEEKYAGQATFSGNIITIGKWVEKEWIAGNNAGNRHKCFIINNLCKNIGVIYYGINSGNFNNLLSWHGEFRNGQREGFGHLKWKDGTEAFLRKRPNWELAPGVWIKSDGTRFEGMIGADWEKGVSWNEEGKVINIGIWKDGSLFINRNDELL